MLARLGMWLAPVACRPARHLARAAATPATPAAPATAAPPFPARPVLATALLPLARAATLRAVVGGRYTFPMSGLRPSAGGGVLARGPLDVRNASRASFQSRFQSGG